MAFTAAEKGTARLATSTWMQGINVTVVPVGLNYNAFRNFGKNVFINFGEPMDKQTILEHASDGKMFVSFNEQLKQRLQPLVYEIDANDKASLYQRLHLHQPVIKKILLAIPAIIGFVIHVPLYYSAKAINKKHFDNDHFDSTLVAILLLAYPLYVLALYFIGALLFNWIVALAIFILTPFTAWSCVQLKKQL